MNTFTVDGKEYELPDNRNIKYIAENYAGILPDDTFFAVVNGKTINCIIDGTDYEVQPGDVIQIHPLVLGG